MRVDGDAAAVVADRQPVAAPELDFDARRVAGDRLVHAVVDDFRGEMVKRALVGPADVHARAAAYGLQPLEHLDRASVVAVGDRGSGGGSEQVGHQGEGIGGGEFREQGARRNSLWISGYAAASLGVAEGGG